MDMADFTNLLCWGFSIRCLTPGGHLNNNVRVQKQSSWEYHVDILGKAPILYWFVPKGHLYSLCCSNVDMGKILGYKL